MSPRFISPPPLSCAGSQFHCWDQQNWYPHPSPTKMPPCRSCLLPTSPIQSGNCGQHQGTHKLSLIGLFAALRAASSEQNGRAEMPRPCAPNSLLPDWETAVLIFSSKCTGAGCWVPRLGRPVGREVCSPVRASALATLRDRGARSCSGDREFHLGSGMARRRGGGTPG